MIAALAVVLALLGAEPLPEIPPDAPVKTYVVQPGDSAWSIAAEFYGSGDLYPIIYKYNGFIGRPPYLLTPGQTLRLPVLAQGPEAQIDWLRRDVRAKPPRSLDWLSAREQMNLWRLYRVSTGDASAARIVFDDTSDLRLREEALLVIYGASASAAKTERADKKTVRLEQGTLTGGLARLDADARPGAPPDMIKVETAAAEIAILGAMVQIQADALAAMISAYDGSARVTAQGASVVVPAGQGTVVKKGRRPEAPRPLPPAPAWVGEAAPALVVALPGGPAATWEASWQPVPGAVQYRVEVAADPRFVKTLYDAVVGAGVTRLRLDDLGVGTWVVRVSTRDAAQLESVPGRPQSVTVAQAAASRRFAPGEGGALEAVGLVEVRAPEGLTVAVGDGRAAPLQRLAPGRHELVWRSADAVARTPIEVVDVTAELHCDEPCREVALALRDARGRPAFVPGLVLEAPSGPLALRVDGGDAATVRAAVPALGPGERLALRARWAGGVLVERELVGPADAEGAVPRRAMVPDRPARGGPRPLVAATPATLLGLDLGAGSGDDAALDLVLRGELALADGELGLDAGLVFADVAVASEVDAAVGDLWLGARWAFGVGPLVLAPRLAAALPVGAGHGPRATTLEPGVVLGAALGAHVHLDARAGALVRLGDVAPATAFDGLVALGLGPATLSWRAAVAGDGLQSTIGLGFAHAFGPVRLGLALGYAPGDAAWSGRVALDVGLGRRRAGE